MIITLIYHQHSIITMLPETTPKFEDIPVLLSRLIAQTNQVLERISTIKQQTDKARVKGDKLVGQKAICKGLKITPATIISLFAQGAPIYKDNSGRYYCYTNEMDDYYSQHNSIRRHYFFYIKNHTLMSTPTTHTAPVDGFMHCYNGIKVFFKNNKPPVKLHYPLIKAVVADKEGMVDMSLHYIDEQGTITQTPLQCTFDHYMNVYFEEEALEILSNIINQLKL